MAADFDERLVTEYLKHIEYNRMPTDLPKTREELKALTKAISARTKADPYFEAWEVLMDLVHDEPEVGWTTTLEILRRCDELDFGSVGAGPLEQLILHHWSILTDRFEEKILSNTRFCGAFSYVRMGGVPLVVQRRLNTALVRTGVDPNSIIEFDEDFGFDEE